MIPEIVPEPAPGINASTKVDGLRELLEEARLTPYLQRAEVWCEEVGAVDIAEVYDAIEEFIEAMGLKVMECKRFKKAADCRRCTVSKVPSPQVHKAIPDAEQDLSKVSIPKAQQESISPATTTKPLSSASSYYSMFKHESASSQSDGGYYGRGGYCSAFYTIDSYDSFVCGTEDAEALSRCEERHLQSATSAPIGGSYYQNNSSARDQQEPPDWSRASLERETRARSREGARAQSSQHLVQALKYAEQLGSVSELRDAIANAEAAGVSVIYLGSARKALAALEATPVSMENQAGSERRAKSRTREQKWNFSGKTSSSCLNDRVREHEAELDERRRNAFSGRGRCRRDADEGEEHAGRYVAQERRERAKEASISLHDNTVGERFEQGYSFNFPAHESLKPRSLRLTSLNCLVDWKATWWGIQLCDSGEKLRLSEFSPGDFLTEIGGLPLVELDQAACESTFLSNFREGEHVIAEQCCDVLSALPHVDFDEVALRLDLDALATDYEIRIELEFNASQSSLVVSGPRRALLVVKPVLEDLIQHHLPDV